MWAHSWTVAASIQCNSLETIFNLNVSFISRDDFQAISTTKITHSHSQNWRCHECRRRHQQRCRCCCVYITTIPLHAFRLNLTFEHSARKNLPSTASNRLRNEMLICFSAVLYDFPPIFPPSREKTSVFRFFSVYLFEQWMPMKYALHICQQRMDPCGIALICRNELFDRWHNCRAVWILANDVQLLIWWCSEVHFDFDKSLKCEATFRNVLRLFEAVWNALDVCSCGCCGDSNPKFSFLLIAAPLDKMPPWSIHVS